MAVSMPDGLSSVQVPGFRDRLGERVVVPQASGVLWEYLYFSEPLASAPFFMPALKERVARLGSFSHSSYCRVRRVQAPVKLDGRPALVSVHVAGRRLTEILEAGHRAGLRPQTAGVMAAAKQILASVALLHDYAPDTFHGALGPERLVLAGEGRIVITEHVLGTVVTEAAGAWGANRVWTDLGVATLIPPAPAADGRRNDIAQIGWLILAMLVGRTLSPREYPDQIPWLLQQAVETAADGSVVSLGAGLREWLERAMPVAGDRGFQTLLEAQKALLALLQDSRYTPSRQSWDRFVAVCETASASMPAPHPPEPQPAPAVERKTAAEPPVAPDPASEFGVAQSANPLASWAAEALGVTPGPAPLDDGRRLVESPPAPNSASDLLVAADAGLERHLAHVPEPTPPHAKDLPDLPLSVQPPVPPRPIIIGRSPGASTGIGGVGLAEAAPGASEPQPAVADLAPVQWDLPKRRVLRPRPVLVLGLLAAIAVAAVVYAPRLWAVVFDEQRRSARLTVESEPAGASVTIDGKFLGVTPLKVPLPEGNHQLDVQNGGALRSKTIVAVAGQRLTERAQFPGSQDRGGLAITTYPGEGRISIDGVPQGTAPIRVAGLTTGSHVLVVETSRGSQTQEVNVEAGQLLPVAVQTVSWVKVLAPYDLEVFEQGKMLGVTGSAAVPILPGRHQLEFVNRALGLKLRQAVEAAPGQLTTLPVDLPMGTLNLTADQPSDVFVDGQSVGATPVSGFTVPLGRHVIAFQNAKSERLVYQVTATLAGPVRLAATFRK